VSHARAEDRAAHDTADTPGPWRSALRRGAVPLAAGMLCLLASWPATEDLDPLLRWVGVILLVLGLVIVVATGRTLSAGRS